jgi:hypothetical protein
MDDLCHKTPLLNGPRTCKDEGRVGLFRARGVKMQLRSLSLALGATALAALGPPAHAQDKSGPNVATPTESPTPGATATMALAHELYATGLAQRDPVTVLAAARLAASVDLAPTNPATLDPERVTLDRDAFRMTAAITAPAPQTDEGAIRPVARASFLSALTQDEGAADAPASVEAMFAKATELAGDDEALLDLIEDAIAEGPGGRIGGVKWLSQLPAGQTDVWEIPFHGKSHAELAVLGDGDANLDMIVTDENGNVLCSDPGWSDRLYCDWTPAWDGYFYLTVQNRGTARNSYHLLTN